MPDMTSTYSLTGLNHLSQAEFVAVLGSIYEHSPWVAERAFEKLPATSIEKLQDIMFEIVLASSDAKRLTLICNHPELAGKEADAGTLTADSQKEQSSAGLNQCSAAELEQLRGLNKSYMHKFGFPFVIAVSGLNKHQIIAALQARLENSKESEFITSIIEIGKIARIRLDALIDV
ncbi:MAG: 2-oxo-4-hydroxy-4-carboxy-5-ureidoimidazoline decarboxylase [Gammaproteobacteria bacterium]|nr:2-oxo-4-hydroxy-4-carboxy-5-ureidoimidazoline decarboxylase [Gammaproteobacteria bacterium]